MKMNKKILLAIFALVLMMFMVSCVPPDAKNKAGQGTTAVVSCVDSDNGQNYNVKGEVALGAFKYLDSCYDVRGKYEGKEGPKLMEKYCQNNNLMSFIYTCPQGCKDGACKPVPTVVSACTDSDNGKTYNRRGYTTQGTGSNPSGLTDYCRLSESSQGKVLKGAVVVEYSCSGTQRVEEVYKCPNGCRDGACEQASIVAPASQPSPQPILSGACILTSDSFSSSTLTPTTTEIGSKYAKRQINGVNTIDSLRNACILAIYQSMESQYCAFGNNKNEKFQRGVLTFKQDGKVESGGGASAAAGSSNVFTCPGYVAPAPQPAPVVNNTRGNVISSGNQTNRTSP